jgi:hypothetical protein
MQLLIASAIGFLLGIVSSILGTVWYVQRQNARLTKRFSKYKGRYVQCDLRGEPLSGDDLWTEITEVDRTLLTTKGNDFGGLEWIGKVLMDDRFPEFGSGHYRYLSTDELDWGLHTIQIAEGGEIILVQVQNVSGGKNKVFPLLWKKTPQGVSKA